MPNPAEHNGGGTKWMFTLVILSFLGLIVLFDETMILPAIPDFIEKFGITYSTSSWLLSAYIIAAAVMTPIAGKLSDVYGRKRMLLIVMLIYIVGLALGRFATNIEFMLFARALQGVGMAMFPIAFGIIRETLPPNKLGMGQTIFSTMFPTGAVVGLIGGAAIIQSYGWQMTFVAILPPAIALWLVVWKKIRIPGPTHAVKKLPLDLRGVFSLAATITLFLSGLTFLQAGGANMYFILALFAGSIVSLACFITFERKTDKPLLDFKIMRNGSFLPSTLVLMLTFLSIFTVYLTIPILVRSPVPLGLGGDALAVANVQLPFMVTFLVANIASGFLLSRIRNTRLTLIGTAIATAGFLLLIMSHSTASEVSLGLIVLGAGLSLSITGGFNAVLVSVPIQMTGIALGMTLLLNLVGMSIGPVVAGIIQDFNQGTVPGIAGSFPTESAYVDIFIMAAVLSAVSFVISIAMNRAKTPAMPKQHAGAPAH